MNEIDPYWPEEPQMGLRDIGVVVSWPIWMGYDYLKNKLFR